MKLTLIERRDAMNARAEAAVAEYAGRGATQEAEVARLRAIVESRTAARQQ